MIAEGKSGYAPIRYDKIENPHLEHISPQTENKEPANGYDVYDEEMRYQYIDCLGNYLLLSGPHNEALSNGPFKPKRDSYIQLLQQREIGDMTKEQCHWGKDQIRSRKKKIIKFLLETY